jgi:nucleoside-triphosphatase THEP1
MKGKPDRTAWLKGTAALCNVNPTHQRSRHRFVLLGAPGVGKGTQAELLAEHLLEMQKGLPSGVNAAEKSGSLRRMQIEIVST